jgi:hypothetical protein
MHHPPMEDLILMDDREEYKAAIDFTILLYLEDIKQRISTLTTHSSWVCVIGP